MIFVTVGTHEQPFDRLVQEMDRLKREKLIQEEVFIQTGYTTYKPQACAYKEFIPFAEMMRRMSEAEIVITHGGTGSIMLVLYHQKIPVVMPRQKKYREHIDDHQVLFCKTMASKKKIVAVYESGDLGMVLANFRQQAQQLHAREDLYENAARFAKKLDDICRQWVKKP
jgi:UDP-N-acetylglucosamine transferase subunit ALG13